MRVVEAPVRRAASDPAVDFVSIADASMNVWVALCVVESESRGNWSSYSWYQLCATVRLTGFHFLGLVQVLNKVQRSHR